MTAAHEAQIAEHRRRKEMFALELSSEAEIARGWAETSERGAIDFALEGLRATYLINAGAIGIIVAAAGYLQLDSRSVTSHALPFFVGLIAAAGFNFTAYFAQGAATAAYASLYWLEYNKAFRAYRLAETQDEVNALIERHQREGAAHEKSQARWRLSAIILAFVSLGAFMIGGAYLICALV